MISLKEIANLLNIHRNTAIKYYKIGALPAHAAFEKGGRGYLFKEDYMLYWNMARIAVHTLQKGTVGSFHSTAPSIQYSVRRSSGQQETLGLYADDALLLVTNWPVTYPIATDVLHFQSIRYASLAPLFIASIPHVEVQYQQQMVIAAQKARKESEEFVRQFWIKKSPTKG